MAASYSWAARDRWPRDDADVWDPAAQRAQAVRSTMAAGRSGHTATLQADGRVVIAGGAIGPARDGEIFDPATGEFETMGRAPAGPPTLSVVWVSPADRARDVAPDAGITLRFSHAVDVGSVSNETIRVAGPDGPVALALVAAESGRLAFARPSEPLRPSSVYKLTVDRLATADGRTVIPTTFSFTTKNAGDGEGFADGEAWADIAGDWRSGRGQSPWQSLPPLAAPPGVTALAGQVLRLNGAPLIDVTLQIDGRTAQTDRTGRFLLVADGLASGEHTLEIDSTTANQGSRTYGFYEARIRIKAGSTTTLPFTIWSPVLDTAHAVTIASPTTTETVVKNPAVPGLELHLPTGTVIRDEHRNVVRTVTITPIPLDRTPFPLPTDATFTMFFTIQPGGAYISTPGPIRGAWLVYPNRTGMASGTKVQFFNYDPDDKGWYVYGLGTVAASQVLPEPRTRLYGFTGASYNSGESPPPGGQTPDGPEAAEPVDPATGAFIMNATDLSLADVMPLALTRTYNGLDTQHRSFGIGMRHSYALFQYTTNSMNEGDLILPNGGRIHYVRTSAAGLPWYQTVFECQTGPTGFYKSRGAFVNNNWEYTLNDGTVYVIGHAASLQAIRDRYGNETRLTWSATNTFGAGYGNLLRVTSPNGRWIEFTYDNATPVNHVTQAKDNIGRTVTFTYDASGRLETVTDPENNVTTYTWDSSNRMTSIEDGRGTVDLTNQYDSSNRVTQQTLADPSAIYTLAYTTSGGGITQTDVTDPRGNVERFLFNADQYVTSRTEAYGTSLARTTTTTRQAGSNLPTAIVDGLNRRTEYTYDTAGNRLTETRLAGTANAATTTYTYDPVSGQVASITDPLNHTATMTYDKAGRLTGTSDPLNHQTVISVDPAGLVAQVTDALQHSWQIGYTNGDQSSFTDPLGNVRSQFHDAVGRVVASTDALGRVSRTSYDKLDRAISSTDSFGGTTSFTYDANGNLLTVSDALTRTTSYTYDDSDRLATRTDPLSHATSYSYDRNDHLTQLTDRKGQITGYIYDALDRPSQVTFDDQSTITYTYDAGDRVTVIADSANGTITRQYDGLDRVTQETTLEGTIDYTYDADGKRTSMTVTGQPAVAYSYDAAHRLTSITQGTGTVSLSYDDADRRTTLSYPNGIVATYTYDNADRLTGVSYALGATTLGDLTYTYDAASNRMTVAGSWARSGLPTALGSATYDAANRIATWDGTSFTYDLNGNLTSDGVTTYTWNARDRLSAMSGGSSASFAYDGLGRRRTKTVGATTTKFLYDGLNPVQELSGSTVVANLLVGLGIDEHLVRTDAAGAANYLRDAIGSSVALADGSGTVQTQYTYEPFGKTTLSGASTTSAFTFAGREADAGGVMFYRGRYYDSERQRFLAEDPIEFAGGSTNLHEYVGNNPVNRIDPLGLQALPMPRPTPGPRIPWLPPWLGGSDAEPQPPPGPYPPPLDYHSKEAQRKCEKARQGCKPCKPPVGTIAYRLDRSGTSHAGVPTPHWHLYVMKQSGPPDCKCEWKPIKDNQGGFGSGDNPPHGTQPIAPAGGGGRRILLAGIGGGL